MSRNSVKTGVVAVVFGWVVACGGGAPIKIGTGSSSSLSGKAVKGIVSGGTVTAYRLGSDMARGAALGTASTDDKGDFALKLSTYAGPLEVVVVGGSYTEEAIGLGVKLVPEMTLVVPEYRAGQQLSGLRVTPISTLAGAFSRYHVGKGEALKPAWEEAFSRLNKHFGGVDWAVVSPADLSVAGVTNLSAEAKAGLVLSGLSWLSKQQAESSGVSPGLSLNAATLMAALVEDATDGTFDGKKAGAPVLQAKSALTPLSVRGELVQAITGFANSTRNVSELRLSDIAAFVAPMASSNDAYLFCPGQQMSATCGGGSVDTEPPVVVWVTPTKNNTGVAGSVKLEVKANDETSLSKFRFTAPESLVDVKATFSTDTRQATLATTFDVSALPDGPVTVRAEATDGAGNPAEKFVTVVVSNKGPRISISAPSDGARLKNTVLVTASAMAQTGTLTKLELVEPPAGMGADVVPAADSFSAQWDTKLSKEGQTTLTFRATDSFGTSTDATVTVEVDNLPAGSVDVYVSAGAPLKGATVKLVAIDATTGLPTTKRADGSILGEGGPTDDNGNANFNLTGENWDGPVQLVATGVSLSYEDPSDANTQVSLPSNAEITSYVASYKSGTNLKNVPVTLWTTVADAAARAYALGKNPSSTNPVSLPQAMAVTDVLMAKHFTAGTPWKLRTTRPVSLVGNGSESLRDVVYAAFGDVALNQLARRISLDARLTPGQVVTAVSLSSQLVLDISDGLFDGQASGSPVVTGGNPPYSFDANTTRFNMAFELDAFIKGTRNSTGLKRADLQTNGVYDAIAGDTSILYPSGQPPKPFDNSPPDVTFAVTFTAEDGSQLPAVGQSHLVARVVKVVADATDASGVVSLSMKVDGRTVAALPGSTATHFEGVYESSGDGPHTFTATAVDSLTNAGETKYAFIADNTKPTFDVQSPKPGFFAGVLTLNAFAIDVNGLGSFVAEGLEGFVDLDTVVEHLAGNWTAPAAKEDGPIPLGLLACDVVKNCAKLPIAEWLDRTPPEVSVTLQPKRYTNQTTVTFEVQLKDSTAAGAGSGVAKVFAQSGPNGRIEAMPLGNDKYRFTASQNGGGGLPSLVVGDNTFTIWGQDTVGNDGQSRQGYATTVQVLLDVTAPTVEVQPQVSATSEATLRWLNNYEQLLDFPDGKVKKDILVAGAVKLASRLDIPDNITAEQLLNQEPTQTNVPFLQYGVTYNAAVDSPIVGFSYFVTCKVGCASSMPVEVKKTFKVNNAEVYLTPLAASLVPQLLGIANAAELQVQASAIDAAGNVGAPSTAVKVNFAVVAPPLQVQQVAYNGSNNPTVNNVWGYFNGRFPYSRLFHPEWSGWGADKNVRMAKFAVFNSWSVPVAFSPVVFATDSFALEDWVGNYGTVLYNYRWGDTDYCGGDGSPRPASDCVNDPNCFNTVYAYNDVINRFGVTASDVYNNESGRPDETTVAPRYNGDPTLTFIPPGSVKYFYVMRPVSTRDYRQLRMDGSDEENPILYYSPRSNVTEDPSSQGFCGQYEQRQNETSRFGKRMRALGEITLTSQGLSPDAAQLGSRRQNAANQLRFDTTVE